MKLFKRLSKTSVKEGEKITNKTVEEFRQNVIKKGKKFKYPVQYEKHKIVINTTIVIVLSLIITTVFLWWGLYRANTTGIVIFKLTQVLPLPAGQVDSQPIRYSDYLAQYRSSMHYYEAKEDMPIDNDSLSNLRQSFQQQAFDNATVTALARKLARDNGIEVTESERQADLNAKLSFGSSKISLGAFDDIMQENYGLDRNEYQRVFIDNPLLIRKVSFAIDALAKTTADEIKTSLANDGSNFDEIAGRYVGRVELLDSGLLKHGNSDGGITEAALKLAPGQVAGPITSTNADGYYFVRLVSKDDTSLRYQSILVRLNELNRRLNELRQAGKVKNYLNIKLLKD